MSTERSQNTRLPQPPPARGVRLDWLAVPASVRTEVERWLGSSVLTAATQPTGFSPGVAARLCTADGRRVFVKAVGPEPNPDVPTIHRREARIVAALASVTSIPRLLWSYDDESTGWVVLVFEDVDGRHPAQPWRQDELERVLDALVSLANDLTPSPLSPQTVPLAGEAFATRLCGWQQLHDEQSPLVDRLDQWSTRYLEKLVELEASAASAVIGDSLLHFDIRADNTLLTREQVWFVDWPLACIGADWVEVVLFSPSVTMQGGPPPEQIIAQHPACRSADPAYITATVAALAGFFTHRALQPPPPGLPTVRSFQAAQGAVARSWLAQRTGWR